MPHGLEALIPTMKLEWSPLPLSGTPALAQPGATLTIALPLLTMFEALVSSLFS